MHIGSTQETIMPRNGPDTTLNTFPATAKRFLGEGVAIMWGYQAKFGKQKFGCYTGLNAFSWCISYNLVIFPFLVHRRSLYFLWPHGLKHAKLSCPSHSTQRLREISLLSINFPYKRKLLIFRVFSYVFCFLKTFSSDNPPWQIDVFWHSIFLLSFTDQLVYRSIPPLQDYFFDLFWFFH